MTALDERRAMVAPRMGKLYKENCILSLDDTGPIRGLSQGQPSTSRCLHPVLYTSNKWHQAPP